MFHDARNGTLQRFLRVNPSKRELEPNILKPKFENKLKLRKENNKGPNTWPKMK